MIERLGSAITGKDIDEAYEQYRYGLKPGFTLYSINSKSKKISDSAAYAAVSTSLSEIPYAHDEKLNPLQPKPMVESARTLLNIHFPI